MASVASGPLVEAYITAALNLGPPALLWTLGDVNGLRDRTGKGNDGMALGGVTVGGVLDGPTLYFDATATLFDGTNDGVGSSYNPFVGTTARTFVGWARWDSGGPQEYTLFGSSAGDADRPTLRVVVGNRDIRWLPSGADGQSIIWPAAAPNEDTWFMWALRADPGNNLATLYIDGTKVSDQSMTDEWPATPGNFQAAIGATTKQPFKGAQGLVAVYEKGLTDAELAALYQASRDGGETVFEHQVPLRPTPSDDPEPGSWDGRCEMTVRADGQTANGISPKLPFTLPEPDDEGFSGRYVLLFQAKGSPLTPSDPFGVRAVELSRE